MAGLQWWKRIWSELEGCDGVLEFMPHCDDGCHYLGTSRLSPVEKMVDGWLGECTRALHSNIY
jgi:hypothetical protein